MSFTPLTLSEVTVRLSAEMDWAPVRGNALVSGDDAFDKQAEDEVLTRLDQGDIWAWAAVTVTVAWNGQEASTHVGCCSYRDEADFRQPGGYFDDLVGEALDGLNQALEELYARLSARAEN